MVVIFMMIKNDHKTYIIPDEYNGSRFYFCTDGLIVQQIDFESSKIRTINFKPKTLKEKIDIFICQRIKRKGIK